MKDTATACSVAAGLIDTAMFDAAIIVPGGNNTRVIRYSTNQWDSKSLQLQMWSRFSHL